MTEARTRDQLTTWITATETARTGAEVAAIAAEAGITPHGRTVRQRRDSLARTLRAVLAHRAISRT